jgi:2-methylcitrate dehydratase PrpD
MSIARILAELAINTGDCEISDSAYSAAQNGLLDTLGCAVAGWKEPGISACLSVERSLAATGKGAVLFYGDKLALPSAIFCNSAMIHAMDFDNNYPGADIHILSLVVPVALACAEESGKSGKEMLTAMILGVEVASRIAKPYCRARKQHNYFLTSSLVGGWGAVASAARLLGLGVEETIHAFGIYYAQTCGNRQALLEKTLTKRIQPAFAARAAVYSVLLAAKGITGSEELFEGKAGFYRLYTQDAPPEENEFHSMNGISAIEECKMKKIPTCGIHHPNVFSAIKLKEKYNFQANKIEKCEFFLQDGANTLVSSSFAVGENPQAEAQFSAPYAIALALNYGKVSIAHFTEDAIMSDKVTAALAGKVFEVLHFDDLDLKCYPVYQNGYKYTKVYLKDGTVFEDQHHQSDVYCESVNEIEKKFLDCISASRIKGNNQDGELLIKKIKQIGIVESITDFINDNLVFVENT